MPITTLEMRVLETNSVAMGIPLKLLMEAAGKSVADYIVQNISLDKTISILVLVGKGGNGGDGLVAARYLSRYGYRVEILPAYSFHEIEHPDTLFNYRIVSKIDSIVIHEPGDLSRIRDTDVIIDALLGTGVKGELKDPIRSIVEKANSVKAGLKIAVDTPTGLNPDTGEVHGIAFKADVTITFHDIKPGLINKEEYTGKIVVANIGIPREAEIYVGPGDVLHRLPKRPRDAHKGMAGKIAVIGGSDVYTGAPFLTAYSALISGADLSYLIIPEEIRVIEASYSPELITLPYPGSYLSIDSVDIVVKYIEKYNPHVVAIGPGLGDRSETIEAVKKLLKILLEKNIFIVLDADALKAIEYGKDSFNYKVVLTPHRGEFKKITGIELKNNIWENASIIEKTARDLKAVVLLKAPIDIISNGFKTRLNKTGNPYMTIGGTGDVLTGLTATFLAQIKDPFTAACIAAYINGLAGDYLLKKNEKVSPMEIIRVIPQLLLKPLDIHIETYLEKGVKENA
ncbi:MAG: NAD(P)H-hydrate dehydratase [Desulfurococcaceae archaeon]